MGICPSEHPRYTARRSNKVVSLSDYVCHPFPRHGCANARMVDLANAAQKTKIQSEVKITQFSTRVALLLAAEASAFSTAR
jgi:hypothetical protein